MIINPYNLFLGELNNKDINRSFIKDFDFINLGNYDNEIDLTSLSKNRKEIRNIGEKLGRNQSSHNFISNHLIFWKIIDGQFYRVDIHINKVLATAAPLLKSKYILSQKIKINGFFSISPVLELTIIFIASLRGRKPRQNRVNKANELKKHTKESIEILKKTYLNINYEYYFDKLFAGEQIKISRIKRLGYFNLLKYYILLLLLFINKLINPGKVITISGINKQNKKALQERLVSSKRNIQYTKNNKRIYLHRVLHDLVIVYKDNITSKTMISANNIDDICDIINQEYKNNFNEINIKYD